MPRAKCPNKSTRRRSWRTNQTSARDLGERQRLRHRRLRSDSLLRIIEQPDTPLDLLRNALRLNGLAVLNQECKDFVLDFAPVTAAAGTARRRRNGESNGAGSAACKPAS